MNLHEISRATKIPYPTVRKYVLLLREKGYIMPVRKERTVELSAKDLEIFEKFVALVKSGLSLSTALERLKDSFSPSESFLAEELYKLRKENEELKKEVRHLRELVELYLSTIMDVSEKLKGLPPPRKSWREKIKAWFIRLQKKHQEK